MAIHTRKSESVNNATIQIKMKNYSLYAGKRTQKGLDNEVEAYRVQYSISKRFPGNNNRRGILGITPTSVQQIRINGKKPYAW